MVQPAGCQTCGAPVASDRCCQPRLLRAVLEWDSVFGEGEGAEAAPDPEPPFQVGAYLVLEKIDTGGMGVVYLACNAHAPEQRVALKMMRNVLASEAALRLFGREILATVLAEHPNIVRVFHVGEYSGRLYYTMQLCDSSLARRMEDFRDPRAAVTLMEVVARAVQYAHDRGVLHLDLKPANILLDRDRRPHIADFGLARVLGAPVSGVSESGDAPELGARGGRSAPPTPLGVGGTPPYMAPEQMHGDVTTASDIHSLGVILCELLTGSADPLSRDAAVRRLERDLAAICRACVRADRKQRYRSARELANDLARWSRGEPVSVGPKLSWRRVWHLAVRQKLTAALLAFAAFLGAAFGASTQHLQAKAIETVQRANSFGALHLAGNVRRELHDYASALERLSGEPELVALVQGPTRSHVPMLERHLQGVFDSIGVYRLDGVRNARWPSVAPGRVVNLHFGWRDYFIGADTAGRMGRRSAYVARCILSEGDGRHKLVMSAPLFDGDRYVGVVMATIDTASTLNLLDMKSIDPEGPTGTLIGLKDRSRAGTHPLDYMVIVHEGLDEGQTADVDHALGARLFHAWAAPAGAGEQLHPTERPALRDADYRDPVPGFEDRWLAGFAQVGRTGLGVVVRTRYRDAVRASDEMIAQMAWWMLALAGGSIALVGVARATRRLGASSVPR